ncbi:transcription-repair coupling factor [Candidatus Cardinium hertigii]|uniref:Transcription-repair-coupling factor n=1 Tax=Candidatus Cardinium hertigii TaxID=247481 RepID=A0A2Z3L7P0_9BACT|nr:transcription-repair coupling factor [Candidatus Cardinium hertigii]AWN81459.1 Transcription-repair-coupling factor [Candidatus Cardinium hertigii]
MVINDLIALYQKNTVITALTAYPIEPASNKVCSIQGVTGSLDALLITALQYNCKQIQLVVTEHKEEALEVYNDCRHLMAPYAVRWLPDSITEVASEETAKNIQHKRTEIIHAINAQQSVSVVVASVAALFEKIIEPSLLHKKAYPISIGQILSIQTIEKVLKEQQFIKVDFVSSEGQFAIRGGIVDIYSATQSLPCRIELWGDQVANIRIFNPKDQKSFKEITHTTIASNQAILQQRKGIAYTSFTSCLPNGSCIWIKNPSKVLHQLQEWHNYYATQPVATTTVPYESAESLLTSLTAFRQIHFESEKTMVPDSTNATNLAYAAEPQPLFKQNFDRLAKDLYKWNQNNYKVFITATTMGQLERINTILEEKEPQPHFIPLIIGLRSGYIDHSAKVVCYTEHQFFNRYYTPSSPKHYPLTKTVPMEGGKNFQVGDYVVHMDHGIGRFAGLHTLAINGHKQEAIRLIYKNNDTIYVNVQELYKVNKYSAKGGEPVNMHKLGTSAWKNKKNAVKKEIKDVAKELITLYAKRKQTVGFAFSKDTPLDMALSASFPYEETADQALAIAAVKEDMERSSPMDRLICGDVGFGKTEIAIRAAFKAAIQGKQVAVLVPTTILALQHYNSFIHRLADFPIQVSYINRFKTKQEIQQTLADTASGKIHILIGTHKLLTKQVRFKDLGLLIIDEEQKFGVMAKEKLKQLRLNIDTLTLTATPIPRTLHFSLMGARDLSILMTPPSNRRPIQTQLQYFNAKVIKQAIEAEIIRNGQVFFIHNKISTIHITAQELSLWLPTARICIAHGQMAGSLLEAKIGQFITGKYDILVATSIIESGMDMPNVNTIIINDSHLLGLADLHQMRGRVGRSNIQAFCYLLIPPDKLLSSEAKLRLRALEEFSALGDGFKLAMSDLDIRGTGDLLGAAQSGFITDIGFETYCKILEEAVTEVKCADFESLFESDLQKKEVYNDCSIETDCEALLPAEYVQNTAHRMMLYTRLNGIKDNTQLTQFKEELVDRFGPLPAATEVLLETLQLRWLAQRMGFQRLVFKCQTLSCHVGADFQKRNPTIWEQLIQYIQQYPSSCQLRKLANSVMLTITKPISTVRDAKELLVDLLVKAT